MDGFVGEIRAFPFPFVPQFWLLCDGKLYNARNSDFYKLYLVINTRFGGDNQDETFNVPDLQGRVPIGAGQIPGGDNYYLGRNGGETDVTLYTGQMPPHTHTAYGLVTTDTASAPLKEVSVPNSSCYPSNIYEVPPPTVKRQGNFYTPVPVPTALHTKTLSYFDGAGGSHSNMQPYLVTTWCICYEGAWPMQGEIPVNPYLK